LDKVISFFEERAGTAFDPRLVELLLADIDNFEAVRLAADDVSDVYLRPGLQVKVQTGAVIAV
ncbi:MAG TPA: hypothetical protein PKW28_05025, partial [Turneriella sp.]|nr:hypothetical protein [Turneriella sp.]